MKKNSFLNELVEKLKVLFSVDLRSLALFRVALSGLILYDLYVRALRLTQYYTDAGVLPRAPFIEKFGSIWRPSIHLMSGLESVQIILFLVAAFFALMLLVGYRTRFATGVSWLLLMSLQARNPMVLQAGDVFFRMLLFFAFFLPLGARFSVDGALEKHQGRSPQFLPQHCFSFAVVGLLLQIGFVYWFTAAIKLSGNSRFIWFNEASAVYYALSIDQFLRPMGYFLASMPMAVLKWLTHSVLIVEVMGPILLFWPIFPGIARILGILSFIGLHLGFGSSLNLGPFPLISVTAVLPFLPAVFWDKLIPSNLKNSKMILAGKSFFESGVFMKKWAERDARLPSCSGVIVANESFSHVGLKRPVNLVLIFFIIYIFIWNMGTVYPAWEIQNPARRIGVVLGFEQTWNMFSPPLRDDGWYVIPGKLKNGSEVDLFREGKPVSWEKPKRVALMYQTERDRKYMMNLWLASNKDYRLYYGKYLCRDWNSRNTGEEQLQSFKINFMLERTRPNRLPAKVEKNTTWTHYCFDVPKEEAVPADKK